MSAHKYNDKAQQLLQSKTKPEAYMHCVVVPVAQGEGIYAIYVWDTRKVLEQGRFKYKDPKQFLTDLADLTATIDNGQPLIGLKFNNTETMWLNRDVAMSAAAKQMLKHAKGTSNVHMIDRQ